MNLSDVVSRAGLAAYAEVALLLFVCAFMAVTLHVFARRKASVWERARHLPLEGDDEPIINARGNE